ncbi:unnamed protein product, partial [Durusdinium trenchii]
MAQQSVLLLRLLAEGLCLPVALLRPSLRWRPGPGMPLQLYVKVSGKEDVIVALELLEAGWSLEDRTPDQLDSLQVFTREVLELLSLEDELLLAPLREEFRMSLLILCGEPLCNVYGFCMSAQAASKAARISCGPQDWQDPAMEAIDWPLIEAMRCR